MTNINPGAVGNDQLYYYILTTFSGPSAVPVASATNMYQYPPAPGSAAQRPRFNEVECNPSGTDTTNPLEFVEIIAPAGMNLNGYFVIHYDGNTNTDTDVWRYDFPSFVVPNDGVTDVYGTPLGFAVIAQTNSIVSNTDFAVLSVGSIMNDADGLVLYDAATNPVDAIVWGTGIGDLAEDDPGTVSTSIVSSLDNYLHDLGADAGDDRSLQAPCDVLNDTGAGWKNLTATPGAMNGIQTNGSITTMIDLGDDGDEDGFLDYYDNCDDTFNPTQSDLDGDGIGNACDDDRDGDGDLNTADNCPDTPNADQADMDSDGTGDVCDYDNDNDGIDDDLDNCPYSANPGQEDLDGDGFGDSCDNDLDNDGVTNGSDNCSTTANATQADADTDGIGDACDPDIDGDGYANGADNCPLTYNPTQADSNSDGIGDACASDTDLDGIDDLLDNCPTISNTNQLDGDSDGAGDACDSCTGTQTTNLLADAAFESGLPTGWSVRTNVATAAVWRFDDPKFVGNLTGGTGLFAVCQSDFYKKTLMDTELRTPSMNMSNVMTASLQFKTDFDYDTLGNSETCDVDVSVNGFSGPWSNVWRKNKADYRGPATENVNLTFAAGYTSVVVRFHYYNAKEEYWWQVDDVRVLCEICDAGYDGDGDGVADISDNCVTVSNASQADLDLDDIGDACDEDIDGDGIVNTWELLYSLNAYLASDALLDNDGDTMINLKEYLADTNPTNSSSLLRISQSVYSSSSQKFSLTFPTSTSRQYRVEFNDGQIGNSNAWYTGIAPFMGKAGSSTVTDSTVSVLSPQTTRYYRVRAQVP